MNRSFLGQGLFVTATLCLAGAWPPSGLPDVPATPEARAHHQLVYHAGEGRTYLIGGSTAAAEGYRYFADVWSWDGAAWTPAAPLPFPRSSHRAVHDAERNSLILFGGGFARAVKAEGVLWEWRGERVAAIGGNVRAGRDEPGVCYDAARGRVVMFGGWDASATYRGDTWEWDGADLVQVDSTGPEPRAGHAFVFDPVHRRCLLFGGRGPDGYLGDTWHWDGNTWRELNVTGPSPRWFFGSAADPGAGRVVVFGGAGPFPPESGRQGSRDLGDTWVWDGEGWKRLSTDGPPARSMARIAFTGSSLILFGGRINTGDGFEDRNDTWELQGGSWQRRN